MKAKEATGRKSCSKPDYSKVDFSKLPTPASYKNVDGNNSLVDKQGYYYGTGDKK